MSFQPVNIDFLINSDAVKAESEKVKKSLQQIGYSAEEAEKKVNQKLNQALTNQALKTLPVLEQQGIRTKRVWNGLGNSINQLSREIPAFAVNAQTGFLAISNNLPILADEIQRLKLKNDALVASGGKGIPVWKQVLKGLLSWQTALSVGVALLTIYGAQITKWLGALLKGKDAVNSLKESQDALNEAYKSTSYKKVIKNIFELTSLINLAKKGVIDKKVALKKYNETLGKVYEKTNDLSTAEKNVKAKTPAWIESMLYRTAAMQLASKAAEKLVEDTKKINKTEEELEAAKSKAKPFSGLSGLEGISNTSFGTTTTNPRQVAEENVSALNNTLTNAKETAKKNVDEYSKLIDTFNEKAAQIANAAGLDIFKLDDDKDPNKTANEYQRLLDKLAEIDKEYSRKSFTKDEEELQALKDKFAKIRTLVERFNADPKNKAQIINLDSFNALEGSASADLVFRQQTDKLEKELEEQQKLYKAFEDYKRTFGKEAAKKEFANKIGEAESYYEYLKDQERKNKEAFSAVKKGTATGGQIERVNVINKSLKEATTEQQKIFNEQLADLLGYYQKRKILIENYASDRAALIKEGKIVEAVELDKQHQDELDKIDDSNIKKLRSYKDLQKGIVGLSKKQAKLVIESAKTLLFKTNISEELKAKIKKIIADLEKEINENSLDNLFRYTERLGEFGETLQELGDVLGSSDVRNAGEFLSGIANGLDDFFNAIDKNATKEEKIAAGIGAAISLIKVFTSAAAKRKAAEEEYYLNVIGFQNQYNLALAEQNRLQTELSENVFITDYVGIIKDAVSGIYEANNGMQDAIDELEEKGQTISGQRNTIGWDNVGNATASGAAVGAVVGSFVPVIGTAIGALAGAVTGFLGGLFGGGKKKDSMTAILKEYPELITQAANGQKEVNVQLAESLLANKLVKGETAEILQNILDWQKALNEARAKINEVISELAGGLGDDLRNALVSAFVAGEDAALKMGETVEKVLENVLSNFIFNQIFEKAFDDLQAQMAASFDIGGDGNWVDDFSQFFTSASALTDDFNQAMQDAQAEAAALGFSIFENENNPNSALSGGIRREITEETGSELLGLFRGFYDLTKRDLELTEEYFLAEKQHHNTTLEILAMNTLIEANTREMVLQIIRSNEFLESIDNTTTDHYLFIS